MKLELKPFKHVVIDNFLHERVAEELHKQFPKPTDDWYKYDNVFEIKRAQDDIKKLPEVHKRILADFNTHIFIDHLEQVFGIEGLIPDPSFRGGGLHQIMPGGKLDIHADFNWHKKLKLHRRLNAILYLNKHWQKEWGGHLELWNKDMTACEKKIAPLFNRMVIFETTDFSYHGHPEKLNFPLGESRKSMAWYFYSSERPKEEITQAHSTLFQKRPQDTTTNEIEAFREKRGKGRV